MFKIKKIILSIFTIMMFASNLNINMMANNMNVPIEDTTTVNTNEKENEKEISISENTTEKEEFTEYEEDKNEEELIEQAGNDPPIYQMGDYDILVPYKGEMIHPSEIVGFVYNDGTQFPEYPIGWINGVLNPKTRTAISMGAQIGYVQGNGYQTFINELYANGGLGWCRERAKDPVSGATYNSGTADRSKQTFAMYVGYDDKWGIMGGYGHEGKFGVTQALVWNAEGTLEEGATVYVHGVGDVSAKYREAINVLNDAFSTQNPPLSFNKSTLETSYDATTNTVMSEDFTLTSGSVAGDVPMSIPAGYYITEENSNTAVSNVNRDKNYVLRTNDLETNATITLTANYEFGLPTGAIYSHPTMSNLQDIIVRRAWDPARISADVTVNVKAATGGVIIPKTHENDTVTPYAYNYSKYTIEIYDSSNVKVASDIFTNAGTVEFQNLLLGNYTYKEINNDNNIKVIKGTGSFTIIPGQTITLTANDGAINGVKSGIVNMSKLLNNNSTETYPVDYKKFGYEITGSGVTKEYWLDDNNSATSDPLKLGTYTWKELSKDKGTIIVKGSGTFTISTDGQVVDLTAGKGAINEVAKANIEVTKKDAEWLTPIFKPSTFGLYDYDMATGTVGNKISEMTVQYITAKGKFEDVMIGQSGTRTVIIKELIAPDGYFLDEKGVVVTLSTNQHNQLIEVDYYNVPEFFTSPEVIKTNADGEVLANVPFKLEQIDTNGNVVKLIETLRTNADGFTRFQNVPSNDENNDAICYRITELRDESNKYYILDQPYEFCGDKNVKIVKYTAVNHPKKISYPIYKVAEENPVDITADGSVWGLYNNKSELINSTVITDGKGLVADLTYKEVTSNMYWQEISVGNDALVLDTNKYPLSDIDWNEIEDGTLVPINTVEKPFVNKIKQIALTGIKQNENGKPLEKVDFALYAQDTTNNPGTEDETVTQNKVEDVMTNTQGIFTTSYYPIYMFDGVELSYMQETATLEHLVLVSSKYNVPTISTEEYKNYTDKQVINLIEDGSPIINYYLRLSLGLYKMNEDQEFLPGVTYGLYDEEKRELATAITDEDGLLFIENIRFDIFVNTKEPTAKTVPVYIREIKVQDADKYVLDYTKYELPNLYGKQDDYKMDDVIWLNTKETAFVNEYLRNDVELLKTDDSGENNLEGAEYRFTRLTGKIPSTEITNEEKAEESTVEKRDIDIQQSFTVTTDQNGKIYAPELLYGTWLVEEIKAPQGYVGDGGEEDMIANVSEEVRTLTFTIDKTTEKISLRFYNTKKAEILVVTGEGMEKVLMMMLGLEIFILSSYLLYITNKKNKRIAKHGIAVLSILTLTMIGLGSNVVGTVQLSAQESISTSQHSSGSISSLPPVNPIEEGEDVPQDPITENPTPSEPAPPIEGEVPTPSNPIETPDSGNSTPVDETEDDTSAYNNNYLASAGEPILMTMVISLAVVIIGGLTLIWVNLWKNRNKEGSRHVR